MDSQQRIRSLLSIRSATETMKGLIQPTLPKETAKVANPHPNISIPALDLPFPSDLSATLTALGLSSDAYSETYRKISELVLNYQNLHSLNYQQICRNLASLPHFQNRDLLTRAIDHMRFAYQNTYAGFLPTISEQILSLQWKQSDICKNTKTPFNNQYTPLLELYFEQNAYPSLPDRKLLARKSMMTMRQIEVWFQNHRARARKEGKDIKKLNGPCQPQLNLEPLKERMPFLSAMDSPRKTSIDINELKVDESSDDESSTTPTSFVPCSFSQVPPPHAFPTTYPSNLPTEPFPNENGKFIFPPPIWVRSPAQPKVQTIVPDMDEFISIFASKLHLRDGSRRKCDVQRLQNAKKHKKPGLTPMLVVPSSAPHPALIRAPHIRSSGTITPLFNSSSPLNPSCTPPVTSFPAPYKPRKFAPFSKRTPSVLFANQTSNRPDVFSAFASRTCSLTAASSQSRSSSLSSVSSAEPATPPLSPTQQEQNPLVAGHGYQLLDELFGPEFDNMSYAIPDLLFPAISLKDLSHNPLYDLSSMFPPVVAQVHC